MKHRDLTAPVVYKLIPKSVPQLIPNNTGAEWENTKQKLVSLTKPSSFWLCFLQP